MNIQKLVSENIKARGYYEGHEPVPLLARHIAKLAEELGEVHCCISFWAGDDGDPVTDFESALIDFDNKEHARLAFDRGYWANSEWTDCLAQESIKKELADLQVVILSMAQIINDNFGEYDVLQAALEKSQKDIERGVR